jgi:hypothetical protein
MLHFGNKRRAAVYANQGPLPGLAQV